MGLRSIPRFDLDTMFLEIYTQREKLVISRILILLGDYMVLETSMLYELYFKLFSEKLNIKILKKAAQDLLIVEYKYNLYQKDEKPLFFYTLKKNGGDYLLKEAGYEVIQLPFFWANYEKSIVLTFNKYFIENGIKEKINKDFLKYIKVGLFLSKSKENAYFLTQITTKQELVELLSVFDVLDNKNSISLSDYVNYVPIKTSLIDFGELTSGVAPNDIK